MHRYISALFAAALCGLIGYGISASVNAADNNYRLFDRSQLRVHTGTSDIDISAADLTSSTTFITITPEDGHAMHDVKVTIDLDNGASGWSDQHTTETVQFLVGRKVDGTNWVIDAEEVTTAITGTASETRSVTLNLGTVDPSSDARIYVLLSAEGADAEFDYVVHYRSGASATFTDVAN